MASVTKKGGNKKMRNYDFERNKKKRVSISKQRQISIPKEFYDALGLENEAMVEYVGNAIVIRPPATEIDFSKQILEDLVQEGYEGQELVEEFARRKANIKPAIQRLVQEAKDREPIGDDLDAYLDNLTDEDLLEDE